MAASVIGLAGCSVAPSSNSVNPPQGNATPATVAYVNASLLDPSGLPELQGYSTVVGDKGASAGTLQLPASPLYYGGPMATDPSGQIYVAEAANGSNQARQILVYAAGSTGTATPSRAIQLPSTNPIPANRIAVDPTGRVYVLNLGKIGTSTTIDIYAANATGAPTPTRTLQLTNVLPPVADIVADAAGNVYCACFFEGQWTVAVYSASASGASMPSRTINFGTSFLYGVGVDTAGDVFVNVCNGCNTSANEIEEFSPGASGTPTPTRTINLSAPSGLYVSGGGPVRIDGAGNIFTSLVLFSHQDPIYRSIPIYGFDPSASGSAAPSVQITPLNGGYNTFFALN